MTKEEQQKDDIETMKILFNADINELCNQRRFNDAREMEGIRDRIIQALEQQPTNAVILNVTSEGCWREEEEYSCGLKSKKIWWDDSVAESEDEE